MFINFRNFFEFMFKSFDVAGDTKMIQKLEKEGVRFLIMVKKHWLYPVINLRRIIVVFLLTIVNTYIILNYSDSNDYKITYFLGFVVIINVFYWCYLVFVYIKNYYLVWGSRPYIEDVYSSIAKSKKSDQMFSDFFNQTIFILVFLVFVSGINIFINISNIISGNMTSVFGILSNVIIIVQISMFYGFLSVMINTEMDYEIVVPGQVLCFNQVGVFGNTQSMNYNKIKTINTTFTGFLSSFLNYGSVLIFTEGDQSNNGEMVIDYIGSPSLSVKEMEKVLRNDLSLMEREVNVLLRKLNLEIGISDIKTPENKEKLKKYIEENDDKMREIFEKGDEETKNELRQLYILVM